MFGILRPYLPWLATTVVSLVLIFSNNNPQVDVLRGRLSDAIAVATRPVSGVLKAIRLWEENKRLRHLLAKMSIEIASVDEAFAENLRLRRMLDFRDRSDFELVAAKVVGMSPDPGIRGLLINRGASDGLVRNSAVVCAEGVVGRLYRVGQHTSTVQLLLDHNMGIAGRLAKGRDNGIIHSEGRSRLQMDGVPISVQVEIDDVVITSGLGGIFPPGLKIGMVESVQPSDNGWLWEILITPCVDFERLEELFIITGSGSDK